MHLTAKRQQIEGMANEYIEQYFLEFSDINGNDYKATIYELNGAVVTPVELIAAGTPCVHTWDTDEVKAAVKGSSLKLTYINDGTKPLTMWYTEQDIKYKLIVECTTTSQKLFIGYMVQDDCNEDLVDYAHEVTLSFTDGLGLLKDFLLDENLQDMGIPATVQLDFVAPIPEYYVNITNTDFVPVVGNVFTVYGHYDNAVNAAYTITGVEDYLNGNYRVQVATFAAGDSIPWRCRIGTSGNKLNFYRRNSLHDILVHILAQCGLYDYTATMPGMDLIYYNTLQESDMLGQRAMFEQVMIDTKIFLNDTSFQSCWDVLEAILKPFKMTLFQAYGQWVVMRWDEFHYANPSGYIYSVPAANDPIAWANAITFDNQYFLGWNQITFPESAPFGSIVRPFKFVKERFDYVQPKYLIYNNDFQVLGPLIQTYTVGTDTYYEYEAPGYYDTSVNPTPTFFIRVIIDNIGQEKSRLFVVRGPVLPGGNVLRVVQCNPFEMVAGDTIRLSLTFQTNVSQPGFYATAFQVGIYDGTTYRFADDVTREWIPGNAWNFNIQSGDDALNQHIVEITPNQVPNDGLLYVFFPQIVDLGPNDETWYSDFRVEYIPAITDSRKINGHFHQQTQTPIIKNVSETDIRIDDAPRNSIGGCMFELGFNNIIQNRTSTWIAPPTMDQDKALGELVTLDDAYDSSGPRGKVEGTFYTLKQNDKIISLASKLTYVGVYGGNDFDFLPGRMEIDYRNSKVNCTMYRLWYGEDVTAEWEYNFNYIYETK